MAYEQKYKKPPITEAVIQFQFKGDLKEQTQQKLTKAYKANYPRLERELEIGLQVSSTQQVDVNKKEGGFKLTSSDNLNIIILRAKSITVSRLAPYEGWKALRETAETVWQKAAKYVDYRDVVRIGVRYINRLDIPRTEIQTGEWVNLGFMLPSTIPNNWDEFALRVQTSHEEQGVNLAFGSTRSPLIAHSSIIVDIDVFWKGEPIENAEDFWNMIDSLRNRKNEIFESAVTDASKALFEPREKS